MFTYIGYQALTLGIKYNYAKYVVAGTLILLFVTLVLLTLYRCIKDVQWALSLMTTLYGTCDAYGKMFTRFIKPVHFTVEYWIIHLVVTIGSIVLIIFNYTLGDYTYYQNLYVASQTTECTRVFAERVGWLLPTCMKMQDIMSNAWFFSMSICFLLGVTLFLLSMPWDFMYGTYWYMKWKKAVQVA